MEIRCITFKANCIKGKEHVPISDLRWHWGCTNSTTKADSLIVKAPQNHRTTDNKEVGKFV